MNLKRIFNLVFIAALALMTVSIASAAPNEQGNNGKKDEKMQVLKFDVAEDMTRFVFDKNVVHEDELPAHGSNFITQGYIYEYGTLKDGTDGVKEDGSPMYPDKMIGEWTCRDYFVGEGAHATTGPMVITTQIYNFGTKLGAKMIITEGYELADVGVAIQRAITGGTGEYMGTKGEASQTFLGFNATEGVSLRYEVRVKK